MRPAWQGPHAGEFAACVDVELARRSLDPWGLPPGRHPPRPPPDLAGRTRVEYVLEHVPEVGAACAAAVPP